MKLKQLVPMLNVSDINASLAFYQHALDFKVVSEVDKIEEWKWAMIRSGDTELMLAQTDATPPLAKSKTEAEYADWPVIFYFYPDDVEALYQHVKAAGFNPTDLNVTFYGMKEFSLFDPDGHFLSFGQDSEAR